MSKNTRYTTGMGTVLTVAMVAGFSAIAADPDLSKLPPASTQKDITYAKDIQPIFKTSCYGCHGADRQKGGLRLDTLEATLKGSHEGKVIIPSKAEKSSLLLAVARLNERDAMPPASRRPNPNAPKALTAEQVGLIRAWIDQGAK
jgi:mono/diheme cytochrome c family protein